MKQDEQGTPHEFYGLLEQVAAIAQNGLAYSSNPYDIERYQQLRAIAAKLISLAARLPDAAVRQRLSVEAHYATPKLDVRGIVLRQSAVLLVQEKADGLWSLPGGWCDVGTSPRESVEREVLEETGLVVTGTRLLALYDKQKHDYPAQLPHAYKCFILCDELGGALRQETHETTAAEFFELDSLPELSKNRITKPQIRLVLDIAKDPRRPTAFD